jgi:hypothetical protein|tara:strand:- start:158 stop:1198 length:1041 start_codon:yes stop_codon:yes gene_type:complete
MSTWKKILTEDDGNLATKNLSTASARTFQLTSSNTLTFLSQHGTEFLKFTSGPVTPNADSVSIEAAALDIRHTVGSLGGVLALREGVDNGVSQVNLKAPASVSASYTLTLPGADGSNGQALVTDGSGNLSFSTISGSGTIDGSGGSDRIAIWSDSDTLTSDSEITYSSATHKITAGAFTAAVVSGVASSGTVSSQTLQSAEINVNIVSTQTVGAFGVGSRLLVKGGSFQGTLNAGRVMRYSQGQGTNPITTADHQSEAAATTMLFCSTDAQNAQELLLEGSIKLASNQGWSTAAQGTPLYLGSSSGAVQSSPPSTQGYYSRIIGYVLDASNSIVYFCPDRSWVKIG